MKKFLKSSLVLAVVLTAMGAHAGEVDFLLSVKKESGKTVSFTLNEVKKVELSLYDVDGRILNTENVSSNKDISRTYDLTALPDGTYFLEAETTAKIARYEIKVANKTAVLSKKAISEVYKPVVVNNKGMVTVSIPNSKQSSIASVIIYDGANNEVYNGDVLGGKKQFDITKTSTDTYTFVVSYDQQTFSETIAAR